VHTSRNSRLADEATHHQSQLLVGSKELWKRTCTAMLKRSLSLRYRPIKPHPFLALTPKVCTARRNSPDQFTTTAPGILWLRNQNPTMSGQVPHSRVCTTLTPRSRCTTSTWITVPSRCTTSTSSQLIHKQLQRAGVHDPLTSLLSVGFFYFNLFKKIKK
jgi:hypothetical protein